MARRGNETLAFFLRVGAPRGTTQHHGRAPRSLTFAYYSSDRPVHDHGVRPTVLIVFDDPLVEARFHQIARAEMARTGVKLPLWVSHTEALEGLGPFGPVWRNPDVLVPSKAFG